MTRTFTITPSSIATFDLNLEEDLNESQRAAVSAGPGPKLVIAGAGTGKTRTITYRVAHLMRSGFLPSQIMLTTFTNKAAKEMLSRVESLTGTEASGIWGGTFHAIGNRLLRRHAPLVGLQHNFSILDSEDQRALIKICVAQAKVKVEAKRFPTPAVIQDLISMSFNTLKNLETIIETQSSQFLEWTLELQQIQRLYEAKKRTANALDYDDLLRFWLKLLTDHSDLAKQLGEQFRYLLVDEYQDTNIVQAMIVERIAEHNGRNLMVVGDDAQSIYRFRGANYDNILNFPERNPGTEVFKLEVNYRSTPEILEFTNASILNNQRQHKKTLTAYRTRGSLPVVLPVNDLYQEAAFVAERVLQLRDDGLALSDMAVLYRAHSHSTIIQAELIKRGIPYEVRSGVRFFEQAHVKDVVSYLKILDNPYDEIAWRRLWLMLPRVGTATAGKLWDKLSKRNNPMEAIQEASMRSGLPTAAQSYFKQFQDDIRDLKALQETDAPAELVLGILQTSYMDYLRSKYENSQTRMEDIQQLAVFARSFQSLRSLLTELILLGELYGQEVAGQGTSDQEQLVLSSIHQAKGLEWSVVFLVRMCEGDFPSERALQEEDGEEEERRIFYVATTRAKDELYISHPLIDMSPRGSGQAILQPSRFLREIRFTLYEQGEIQATPSYQAFDGYNGRSGNGGW